MMNRETIRSPERERLAHETVAALLAAAARIQRELDRHAADHGLSDAKLQLLDVLSCRAGEEAGLNRASAELGVSRPNITKLVDGLERAGLVQRCAHPTDGRKVLAQLTPAGTEVALQALPDREARVAGCCDELTDGDLQTLCDLLRRLPS